MPQNRTQTIDHAALADVVVARVMGLLRASGVPSREEIQEMARAAVPRSLRRIDSAPPVGGRNAVLCLGIGDAFWGDPATTFALPVVAPQWSILWTPGIDAIEIVPGDLLTGAQTWIQWGSITGATTTPALTSTNVCCWVEENVTAGTAEMVVGKWLAVPEGSGMAKPFTTTGDPSEADQKVLHPIVKTTWTSGHITAVEPMHSVLRNTRSA